jgi:hypothetical protein
LHSIERSFDLDYRQILKAIQEYVGKDVLMDDDQHYVGKAAMTYGENSDKITNIFVLTANTLVGLEE